MKRIASLLLAACLLAAPQLTGKAQAEGFALSDFGARGTALAGGMVARADDPSAVAWNPAGITQLPGTQIMVGMTAIQPSGTVYVGGPLRHRPLHRRRQAHMGKSARLSHPSVQR